MLNQVIIVGRIKQLYADCFEVLITGTDHSKDTLVRVHCSDTIMDNVKSYVSIDSIVGVRGRLENDETQSLCIIGDKISFLSSTKEVNTDGNE